MAVIVDDDVGVTDAVDTEHEAGAIIKGGGNLLLLICKLGSFH